MLAAYKKYWKHYADFSGRSSRSDYWWVVLMNTLIIMAIMFIFVPFASLTIEEDTKKLIFIVYLIILFLFVIANIIPSCANIVRRLRDAGYHWSWIFLYIAGFFFTPCNLVLLIFLCRKTKLVENTNQPGFVQQSAQGQQFGQAPQDFSQQPTQQNIQPAQEQQSSQPVDNPFETKD